MTQITLNAYIEDNVAIIKEYSTHYVLINCKELMDNLKLKACPSGQGKQMGTLDDFKERISKHTGITKFVKIN